MKILRYFLYTFGNKNKFLFFSLCVKIKSIQQVKNLANKNVLVRLNFKVENIAGKTGYIDDSGYNFTVSLTNEKKHSITVVVFGAATNEDRFSEARDLAEWSFDHYLWPGDSGYEDLVE